MYEVGSRSLCVSTTTLKESQSTLQMPFISSIDPSFPFLLSLKNVVFVSTKIMTKTIISW